MSNNEQYFANREPEDLATILIQKSDSFFNQMRYNSYLDQVAKSWRFYYGMFNSGLDGSHQVSFTGEQGELVQLPVNHFRNIAQHIYVMITSNRPSMEARAVNTDYKSLAQTYLANGILDYYMREKGLEDALKSCTEMAVVLGAGYIKMEWNATAGEPYDFDEETGQNDYQGEIEFTNLSPFDVIFDGTRESFKNDWIITRSFKNRYDLMAKYPESADKIRSLPVKTTESYYRLAVWSNDDTDDVPVYEFFHKKTEAVPDGKYMLFLDQNVVLMPPQPMPYRTLPIFRMTPGEIMGTPYGYTPMFDIYPLQEALNSLYSTVLSNQNAFGVQSIWIPPGANITTASVEGGMNIIQSIEKPEPIQLTATAPEVFDFIEQLVTDIETISGINSVTRGNPEASLESGTALALVQSMALQYISGLQQSYVRLIEQVGTELINNLKDFGSAPRIAALVGKNNKTILKEFTGDDLSAINRVVVDIGNPLARTTAGRVQMAEQMLQMNLIKDPQDYFQVLNTGKLDPVFEASFHEQLLIRQENEKLTEGGSPVVSPLDKHSSHINEHKTVLSDSDVRNDPELVKIVMDHIEGHLDALRNVDPALLQLIGETPLPPAQPLIQVDAQGNQMPPQGQNGIPDRTLARSPMNDLMQPPQVVAGDQLNGQPIPSPAKPPAPFKNLPTDPAQMPK